MTSAKAAFLIAALSMALWACSSAPTSAPATADPLSGTWTGTWGPGPSRQTQVTLDLQWDGTTLRGTVNPGPSGIEVTKAAFDPQTQSVTMELDGPNSRREIVHYVIKGKISGDTMVGTFDRAGETGDFRLGKR